METQSESRKKRKRLLGTAMALAVCLGTLPVLAGQDQPPAEDSQQTMDQAPPPDAPEAPPPAYRPVPPRIILPAGTIITVRTSQFLSSDKNHPGDSFSAELQQPVIVDGWVVARRGQTVLGRVAVAQKAGRIKGVSQLGVELTYLVLVDGQQLPIRTQLMQTSAGTSKGRDAGAIATTTGTGAVIGAAVSGASGAGIGTAIGAATGLTGVLLTRGRSTILPPETRLTFQLQSQVAFSTQRSGPAFRPAEQADYGSGTLQRRTQRVVAPPPPAYYPYPFWGYSPWGYAYPGPVFFGFYGFGGRFGRGHFHR